MISNVNFSTSAPITESTQVSEKISQVNKPNGMDDKVFMSDNAKMVMEMLDDQQSPEDFQRIVQLQQAIENGSYVIQADKIADKLLQDMSEF